MGFITDKNMTLYITVAHACSYIEDQLAVNLLVDPAYPMRAHLYAHLLDNGFRRSGGDVYRPHCKLCNACVSTRIPVTEFQASRSQKRNLKQNQDIEVRYNRDGFKPEYEPLYRRYVHTRHCGCGMDTDESDAFKNFLVAGWCSTTFIEFWLKDSLVGVATTDELSTGLSLVYTFYDPILANQRGLGTFAILTQIAYAQQLGLPYVYPGYWIEQSQKMSYKIRFQPIEGYINGQWSRIK